MRRIPEEVQEQKNRSEGKQVLGPFLVLVQVNPVEVNHKQ